MHLAMQALSVETHFGMQLTLTTGSPRHCGTGE